MKKPWLVITDRSDGRPEFVYFEWQSEAEDFGEICAQEIDVRKVVVCRLALSWTRAVHQRVDLIAERFL